MTDHGTAEHADRQVVRTRIDPLLVRRVAAVLDRDADDVLASGLLPALWHWAYFADIAPQSALGHDGHPLRGDSWAADLPRRMYAGGRIEVDAPLHIGAQASRRSDVSSAEEKQGRRGRLLFVTIRDEITDDRGGRLVEERDLVYLAGTASAPEPEPLAAPEAPWRADRRPDPVLLFRFSAITFNGHRIHYDRAYATEEEGYPDLVVHGPLLAMWLCELGAAATGGRRVRAFAFRARQPVFLGEQVALRGWPGDAGGELAAYSRGATPAMTATLRVASSVSVDGQDVLGPEGGR